MTLVVKYFAADIHCDEGGFACEAQTFDECFSTMVRNSQKDFGRVQLEMFRKLFRGAPGFVYWDDAVICIRRVTLTITLATGSLSFDDGTVRKIPVDEIWDDLIAEFPLLGSDDANCVESE